MDNLYVLSTEAGKSQLIWGSPDMFRRKSYGWKTGKIEYHWLQMDCCLLNKYEAECQGFFDIIRHLIISRIDDIENFSPIHGPACSGWSSLCLSFLTPGVNDASHIERSEETGKSTPATDKYPNRLSWFIIIQNMQKLSFGRSSAPHLRARNAYVPQ